MTRGGLFVKKLAAGEKRVICSNASSPFGYFAWPSVIRLDDGKIACAMSGFRLKHICPFGKACIMYSSDEGKTWTNPAPVIDTPLDDRDAGLTSFGKGRLIMTSFNNTTGFQESVNMRRNSEHSPSSEAQRCFIEAYIDLVRAGYDENKYLGSTYRISEDGGNTFGPLRFSPVTAPHGPMRMLDGSLMYIGRRFSRDDSFDDGSRPFIECHKLNASDSFEYVSAIENIEDEQGLLYSCEPHAVQLQDGRIIVHIRVQGSADHKVFTIYQSESYDNGLHFTKPHRILGRLGGAPAHLLLHSGGMLVSVCGYREKPCEIRAMFSRDGGETWDTDWVLDDEGESGDLGYPASVELSDGSILTVYYENKGGRSSIFGKTWTIPRL